MIALGLTGGVNGATSKGVTGFIVVGLAGCHSKEQYKSQASVLVVHVDTYFFNLKVKGHVY